MTTPVSTPGASCTHLEGAYDTHVHAGPDVVARRQSFLEVARDASTCSMAGLVFKDVTTPTVDRAHAVRSIYPGLDAIGGIVLDLPVGGLNPRAVRVTLERGGRIVWMPVVHARHTLVRVRSGVPGLSILPDVPWGEALTVLTPVRGISDPVREIVHAIAEHDAVLATGHLAPEESLELLAYARDSGVRRMLVNHPCAPVIGATLEQQAEMARMGAVLEHCAAHLTPLFGSLPLSVIEASIRTVGVSACLLATDLGQPANEPAVSGLSSFATALEARGLTHEELGVLMKTTARRLFH